MPDNVVFYQGEALNMGIAHGKLILRQVSIVLTKSWKVTLSHLILSNLPIYQFIQPSLAEQELGLSHQGTL